MNTIFTIPVTRLHIARIYHLTNIIAIYLQRNVFLLLASLFELRNLNSVALE